MVIQMPGQDSEKIRKKTGSDYLDRFLAGKFYFSQSGATL